MNPSGKMTFSRRRFFKYTTAVTVGFTGLQNFHFAHGAADEEKTDACGYGKLIPDPKRLWDLPEGFSYQIIGRSGDYMDDGFRSPGASDGMAAFPGPEGRTILVVNHELYANETYFGPYDLQNRLFPRIGRELLYDPGGGVEPHIGGASNIVFDTVNRKVERRFLSLAGTCRNCAGGTTPWNSWISCEETVERKAEFNEKSEHNEKDHGYNFEVPVSTEIGLAAPVPLVAMGRFNHEAVAVDPKTSIVYQTEDRNDGLIYRFIPNEKQKLAAGGTLQVLIVVGQQRCDTRNWPDSREDDTTGDDEKGSGEKKEDAPARGPRFKENKPVAVTWKTIGDVESPEDDLRKRGYENLGAARFARAEGMWFGDGEVYFACTNGGEKELGQIFRYKPSPFEGTAGEEKTPGTLELFIESRDKKVLKNADNLCVAPWGDVIACEDGQRDQRLLGITPDGRIYPIGKNRYNKSEVAGVCFSPDASTLFVNIYEPGITLAISGAWDAARHRT